LAEHIGAGHGQAAGVARATRNEGHRKTRVHMSRIMQQPKFQMSSGTIQFRRKTILKRRVLDAKDRFRPKAVNGEAV
jgi:hypothetical protein